MASPKTFARALLVQASKSIILFCTDGGANDGKGVEVTGTSDGSINVNLTGGAVGGQTVAQGTAGSSNWRVIQGNPTAVARGSQACSGSAVALGGVTAYTGGILIWNSSGTLTGYLGTGTPTAAPGSNTVVLGPGQGYVEPSGNLAALKIIAANSDDPVINWIGMTL